MRTGLRESIPELPWCDALANYPHPRIQQLIELLHWESLPLSRHFLMSQLEADVYLTRDEGLGKLEFYDSITEQHHSEMDSIRPALIMQLGAVPLLETYRQASIRHEYEGNAAAALKWGAARP
jgi:hypothetical protein